MADYAPPGTGDFESLARQYWNLWGDALRRAGGAPAAPAPGWQQALDWWTRLMPPAPGSVEDVMQRFRHQSGDWFGMMQQVAAQFAGRDASAADIAQAWKQAMGSEPGSHPWLAFFRNLQGGDSAGFDGWYRQVAPYLETLRRDNERWLHLPTFGLAREHQERWQALAHAQQDYQHQVAEYERLMMKIAQRAFECFEQALAGHAEPGQQITSARALFDLWIDAAEQAYGEVALSDEFRRSYGALANAQMRLRLGVQREVEQICQALGMPTRTEVDSAHRKIAELERSLRRLTTQGRQQPGAEARAPARDRQAARDKPRQRPAKATAKKPQATRQRTHAPQPPSQAAGAAPAKAAKKPVAAKAGKAARPTAVVSMKEWVARNAEGGPKAAGKAKPAGKGRQGGRK